MPWLRADRSAVAVLFGDVAVEVDRQVVVLTRALVDDQEVGSRLTGTVVPAVHHDLGVVVVVLNIPSHFTHPLKVRSVTFRRIRKYTLQV